MDFYLDWIISERSNTSSRVHPFSRRLLQRTGFVLSSDYSYYYYYYSKIIGRLPHSRLGVNKSRRYAIAEFAASIQFLGGGLNKFTLTRFAGDRRDARFRWANRLNCD